MTDPRTHSTTTTTTNPAAADAARATHSAHTTTATHETTPRRSTWDDDDPWEARGEAHGPRSRDGGFRSALHIARELAQDVGLLARQEAQLARAEIGEKVDQVRAGVTELGAGAAVAYAGFLVLLVSAVFGLNVWIGALWLSALIVGGVVTLIGLAMLGAARKNLQARNLAPRRTVRSLKEDAELARQETTGRMHG